MANHFTLTDETRIVVIQNTTMTHREVLYFDSMADVERHFATLDEPNNGYYKAFMLGEEFIIP